MSDEKEKIAYCCDYKASCAGPGCLCNGGECSHTFDPEHARFGPTDDPAADARFYQVKAPDLPATWWEIVSLAELREWYWLEKAKEEAT